MKSRIESGASEVRKQKSETEPKERKIFPQIISHFLIVFLLAIVCRSAARAATIQGTVFDASGSAVAAAHVHLLSHSTPVAARETDSNGRFSFQGLTAGTYTLVAESPGLSATLPAVEVEAGETRAADIRMHLTAVEEHVVVSASLEGALAPEVGSSVSVVSRSQLQDIGAQSVSEGLREVPGVAVNQTGRRGGVTGVFIRGGDSNYNLVLIDGIEVNEFGGDFDFAPIAVDGVERVEVTRGPQSALYGSNAVAGVVNIITERGEGPPRFSALAEGGSFGTWRGTTSGSGLTDGISWAYDLSRLDSDGVVQNDWYRNQSAFLTLGISRSARRDISFHFFGDANNAGAPGPFGSDPDHLFAGIDSVSRDKQNLFGYEATYTEQLSPRFKEVVTGNVAANNYYFISSYGDSISRNLRGGFNSRSELTISNQDLLVAGFEFNHEQIKNTYITNDSGAPFVLPRRSFAFFAENRWRPARRVFVIAGVRADDIRTGALPSDSSASRPSLLANSILKVSPRLSVAYMARQGTATQSIGATRVHGSFGTGIRAPNGFELAFNNNNPSLQPERSVSFDAGVEQRFLSDRAAVDVAYFYNRFEDQIVVLGGSLTNLSTFTSANLGNSRAQGMEFSARFRPSRTVQIEGGYTLLATSILALSHASVALSPFQVGQPLIRRPKNSGFADVTWRRGHLSLKGDAYFRGGELDLEPNDGTFACELGLPCLFQNPGYALVNGGFSYQLPHGVELYGRLDNLLNQKYEESFGYPSLHLNFLAGIRVRFPAR